MREKDPKEDRERVYWIVTESPVVTHWLVLAKKGSWDGHFISESLVAHEQPCTPTMCFRYRGV